MVSFAFLVVKSDIIIAFIFSQNKNTTGVNPWYFCFVRIKSIEGGYTVLLLFHLFSTIIL
jgi:hypothetical protein